jgi:hypothetical protein
MKTLVLWSGGVESTSLLKHLLETTDDEIHAVHIYNPTIVGRAHLEWTAVNRLYPRLNFIRPFALDKVDVHLPWIVRDGEIQIAILPALIYGLRPDRFLRGLCAEDWEDGRGGVYGAPPGPLVINEHVYAWVNNVFHDKWASSEDLSPLSFSHLRFTKKEHMLYLSDLLELTWSCLTPQIGQPCGRCSACMARK